MRKESRLLLVLCFYVLLIAYILWKLIFLYYLINMLLKGLLKIYLQNWLSYLHGLFFCTFCISYLHNFEGSAQNTVIFLTQKLIFFSLKSRFYDILLVNRKSDVTLRYDVIFWHLTFWKWHFGNQTFNWNVL